MNTDNIVSVCIPVYNGEKYIKDTVISVLNQKYKNIELLIQDNNSYDKTVEIISSISDKRIKLEKNSFNVSMSSNWNKVISRASGDYMMILSADDMILPDFIEKCLEIFKVNKDVDIVSSNHFILRDKIIKKRKLKISSGTYTNYLNTLMLFNPFSINFSVFKRKTVLDLSEKGYFFTSSYVTCDYDLWFRAELRNKKIFFINEPLGIYRVHSSNLSNRKNHMNRQAFLTILKYKNYFGFLNRLVFRLTVIRFILRVFLNYLQVKKMDRRFLLILFKEFFR